MHLKRCQRKQKCMTRGIWARLVAIIPTHVMANLWMINYSTAVEKCCFFVVFEKNGSVQLERLSCRAGQNCAQNCLKRPWDRWLCFHQWRLWWRLCSFREGVYSHSACCCLHPSELKSQQQERGNWTGPAYQYAADCLHTFQPCRSEEPFSRKCLNA